MAEETKKTVGQLSDEATDAHRKAVLTRQKHTNTELAAKKLKIEAEEAEEQHRRAVAAMENAIRDEAKGGE